MRHTALAIEIRQPGTGILIRTFALRVVGTGRAGASLRGDRWRLSEPVRRQRALAPFLVMMPFIRSKGRHGVLGVADGFLVCGVTIFACA
jgi:hypothetical protein